MGAGFGGNLLSSTRSTPVDGRPPTGPTRWSSATDGRSGLNVVDDELTGPEWPAGVARQSATDVDIESERLEGGRSVAVHRPDQEPMRPLSVRWALFAGLIGPGLLGFSGLIGPSSAESPGTQQLIITFIGLAILASYAGAAVTAFRRRPQALSWAVAVGSLSVALLVVCQLVGGPGTINWQWWAQLAAAAATVPVATYGRSTLGSTMSFRPVTRIRAGS